MQPQNPNSFAQGPQEPAGWQPAQSQGLGSMPMPPTSQPANPLPAPPLQPIAPQPVLQPAQAVTAMPPAPAVPQPVVPTPPATPMSPPAFQPAPTLHPAPTNQMPSPEPRQAPAVLNTETAVPELKPSDGPQFEMRIPHDDTQPATTQVPDVAQEPPANTPASPQSAMTAVPPSPASPAFTSPEAPLPVTNIPPPPLVPAQAGEPVATSSTQPYQIPQQPQGQALGSPVPAQATPPALQPNEWFKSAPAVVSGQSYPQPLQQAPHYEDGVGLSYSEATKSKRKRSMLLLIIACAAVLIAAASAYVYSAFIAQPSDPQAVFNTMLKDTLSTKQLHHSITQNKSSFSAQTDYDVSDVTKPRIASQVTFGSESSRPSVEYFSTFQDTFVKYLSDEESNSAANKWIQVRKSGVLEANSELTLVTSFEARAMFFGQMVFGNFEGNDKAALTKAIQDGVYTFDTSKVREETLNDKKVLVYDTKINTTKLVAYNQQIAKIVGVNEAEINKSALESISAATLYIETGSKHLVKVVTSDTTVLYSKYNDLTVAAQPTPQITWAAYVQSGNSAGVTPSSSPTTSNGAGSGPGDTADTPGDTPVSSGDTFDDPNFDDPLWDGDAGEAP